MHAARPDFATPTAGAARRERGMALLIVLLLSAVLIPIVAEFAFQIDVESRTALNVKEQLAIDNAIEGQYQILIARVEFDGIANEYDSYDDSWNASELLDRSEPTTNVRLRTVVQDEQAKLPLRKLVEGSTEEQAIWKARLIELLKRFRANTPFDVSNIAEELADEIVRFFNGQNRGQIPKPNTINNSPVITLDDLHFASEHFAKHRLLEDVREGDDVGYGLWRFVTIYGSGRINLNTAEQVVLESLFPKDVMVAERIIERRQASGEGTETESPSSDDSGPDGPSDDVGAGNPFTDVNQVNEIEGVNLPMLRANNVDLARDFEVKSNFFSARIAGSTDNTRREELFVFERVPDSDPNNPPKGVRHLLCQERIDRVEDSGEEDEFDRRR